MRDFTPEEKELIINTPITEECFEIGERITFNYERMVNSDFDFWDFLILHLETLQEQYKRTKDEKYFNALVRLLPNSYKFNQTKTQSLS